MSDESDEGGSAGGLFGLARLFSFRFESTDPMERASEFESELPLHLIDAYRELVRALISHGADLGGEISNEAWNSFHSRSGVTAGECAYCGKAILRKRTSKQFCSATCRVQADRAKNFS